MYVNKKCFAKIGYFQLNEVFCTVSKTTVMKKKKIFLKWK